MRRKPLSATINTLANALYRVFCASSSTAHEEMRQACFDYLALGGMYSSEWGKGQGWVGGQEGGIIAMLAAASGKLP